MDIGQPRDYLQGVRLHLESLRRSHPEQLSEGPQIEGNAIIDPTAEIGEGCLIGPGTVVGARCRVGRGTRIVGSTLLPGVTVGAHSFIADSIIGWDSNIEDWCRVEGMSVLGEDVTLKKELCLNGGIILPHKGLKESMYVPGTIVM